MTDPHKLSRFSDFTASGEPLRGDFGHCTWNLLHENCVLYFQAMVLPQACSLASVITPPIGRLYTMGTPIPSAIT